MQRRFYLLIVFVLMLSLVLTGCPFQSTPPGKVGDSQATPNNVVLSTLQSPFQGAEKNNWWIVQSFGAYYSAMGGCHPGEDWHTDNDAPTLDGVNNASVYSIATGKVVKIGSAGVNNGYYVVVEHTGKFLIPESSGPHLSLSIEPLGTGKLGSNNGHEIAYSKDVFNNLVKTDYQFTDEPSYTVNTKIVNKIYSVYMHVQDPEIVKKNDPGFMDIKVGTVIDDITKPIAKLQKITSTDSNGVVTNVSHLHFEIRDGKIIDNFLQDKKSAPLNAVVNNLSANGYFPYKTDSVTKKNTVQDLITDGYCEPSYVIQQNHGQTVTLESPSKTTTIADGTYPIYVTNASIDNGTCYLKFKTTTKYYIIVDYLLKVWVQGKSPEYDMNKYYESNYPVTEYKNGKVNSIPIQNLPKIIGKSKSELLAILANYPAPDDDYNFYSLVNDSELQYKISDNCDISLSGSLSTHAGRLEKISSQELVNRINKYLNKSSNNKYIYDISIEIKSGEMVTFSEAYRS